MLSKEFLISFLSGGSAGAIVSAVWKLLLQRRDERSKEKLAAFEAESKERLSKVEADLRLWQNVVQARIDRSVFVTRTQFETEFEAMKEAFDLLSQVRIALYDLWPTSTYEHTGEEEESKFVRLSRRLQSLMEAHDSARTLIEARRPFFPADLYDMVTECLDAAQTEAHEIRMADRITLYNTWFRELTPVRSKFSKGYTRAGDIIRDRMSTLAVLPRS